MSYTNNQLENAINKGLVYLENLLTSKPWAFSVNLCSRDRSLFFEEPENMHTQHPEAFTHFIALDLLGNNFSKLSRHKLADSLLNSVHSTINYFVNPTLFPDEVDTTALGYSSLIQSHLLKADDVSEVAQIVFSNVNKFGIVEIYFNNAEIRRKNKICACVCANVLRLAYLLGEESKLENTESYVFDWLESGNWKQGSLYYPSGFSFLYLCSNFAMTNCKVQKRFRPLLLSALENSIEDCKFPLDYAQLLLTLENLRAKNYSKNLLEKLLSFQNVDGSWPPDSMWGNTHGRFYGGKPLSTIFAVGAITSAVKFS
ncbi:unnamed protein product [Allacma fusca]|uniref:Uncharacterized protein n=1 Tax=Allacma fusca TaxID=39272 RepID=A0A8J2KR33_9HEXA|nr:unnamed protein product [Allacma fusca]